MKPITGNQGHSRNVPTTQPPATVDMQAPTPSDSVLSSPLGRDSRLERWLPWGIALAAWLFYLAGIQNHAPQGDGSELAAAACRLGVTHPTGYPLFTLLGHLFCLLPLPVEAAAKVALMASLFGAGAVLMFIRLGWTLLRRTVDVAHAPRSWFLSVNLAGLVFGLSPVLYGQSRVAEVYSLHVFLMSLAFWFMLRFDESGRRIMVVFAAIFMALGLAHHMTTSQLLPAALVYLLAKDPRFFTTRYFALGILAGIGGAMFYLYLPLADVTTDAFPWGGTSDPYLFWRHVTGAQYRHYLYENSATTWRHVREVPLVLWDNLNLFALFVPFGVVAAIRRWGRFSLFVLIYLALANLHLLGYNVSDYRVYYTAPLLSYTLLALVGFAWVMEKGMKTSVVSKLRRIPGAVVLLLPVISTTLALVAGVAQSGGYRNEYPLGRDYGNEVTATLPAGSIVLQRGDTFNYSAWYYQNVKNQGRDVAVINVGRLRDQWYVDWTKRRWPWLTFEASTNPRKIVEQTLKRHLGERRIFTKGLAERKQTRPRGAYRFLCRGYVHEILRDEQGKGEGPMFKQAVLSSAMRGSRAAFWKRSFRPKDKILLSYEWYEIPKRFPTLEWVSPDGQVVEQRVLDLKTRWVSLKTKQRPLGTWKVRAVLDGKTYMELAFEIGSP